MQLRAYNNLGRTIARPGSEYLSVSNFLVEGYIFAFIFLFLSDATPFRGWSLSVFVSAPLAFLGVMNFPKATPSLRFFCLIFIFSWAYQDMMIWVLGVKLISVVFATLFIVIYYQEMGENGLNRLKNYIAVFFLASFVLFLGTLYFHTALVLREGIYAGLEGPLKAPTLFRGQGGLASTIFFLSYQLAAGMGLFVGEYLLKSKFNNFIPLSGLVAIAGLALILSGERSPVIALGAVCLVFLFIRGKTFKFIRLSLIIISIYIPFAVAVGNIVELKKATAVQRIMDAQQHAGALERLKLQLWALTLIPQYPLGIRGADVKYDSLIGRANVEDPVAPHNGYITRTLSYGWFLLILVFLVFHRVIKMILIIKRKALYETIPVLCALVGTLINACFHNQSFITFQSDAIMLLMLFAGYFDYSLKRTGYQRVRGLPASITNGKNR